MNKNKYDYSKTSGFAFIGAGIALMMTVSKIIGICLIVIGITDFVICIKKKKTKTD